MEKALLLGEQLLVASGKGSKSRAIILPDETVAALKEWLRTRPAHATVRPQHGCDPGPGCSRTSPVVDAAARGGRTVATQRQRRRNTTIRRKTSLTSKKMASPSIIIHASAEAESEEVLRAIDRDAWILFLEDCLRLARVVEQRERVRENSASCEDEGVRLLAPGR